MRVSTSVGYGLLAVGYIAQHKNERIILSDRIAEEYDIPLEYLLRIMQLLVRRQVLKSKRGPGGGFSLGRPLNKITVLDVVEAIDGPMDTPLGLEEHAARDRFAINASKTYDKAVAQARSVLRKVKISELI
ncbi:MAG: RrF2 family transcriptional regulator [Planctomycetota bacterium]|jgi:Rrf2 family protein